MCIRDSCQVVGTFMCQGRMPEAVKRRYEGMLSSGADEESVRGMIENFERAKTVSYTHLDVYKRQPWNTTLVRIRSPS